MAFSKKRWQYIVRRCASSKRFVLAGGISQERFWFSQPGSMTQQLRATGNLQLTVEWFNCLSPSPPFKSMWIRHTHLATPHVQIEAWVWLAHHTRFQERLWFNAAQQPVGDVLFKRNQMRRFRFFKLPRDHRLFRYSNLTSPQGNAIHIIEAWNRKLQPTARLL